MPHVTVAIPAISEYFPGKAVRPPLAVEATFCHLALGDLAEDAEFIPCRPVNLTVETFLLAVVGEASAEDDDVIVAFALLPQALNRQRANLHPSHEACLADTNRLSLQHLAYANHQKVDGDDLEHRWEVLLVVDGRYELEFYLLLRAEELEYVAQHFRLVEADHDEHEWVERLAQEGVPPNHRIVVFEELLL